MKQKKIMGLFLVFALMSSLLAGCGNTSNSTSESQPPVSAVTEEQTANVVAEQKGEAEQLLLDLKGTYQELWPVVLADEYDQLWLDTSAELVGKENAEGAVAKMTSMVT